MISLALIVLIWTTEVSSGYSSYILYVMHQNNSSTWVPVLECDAAGADFGLEIGNKGDVTGCGQTVVPSMACGKKVDPPGSNSTPECRYYMAIVPRGNCSFAEKAYDVQEAGFKSLIVFNSPGEDPMTMADDGKFGVKVEIPAIMVSYWCAQQIKKYPYTNGYVLLIQVTSPTYDLVKYLIPFLAVVGICFLVMIIAMVIKLVRDKRRRNRRRLSTRNLRKIPTKKFRKGDEPETCPICLDDFEEGEKLRVLPCKHAYHCKCVDPWLTKNRKVCPVCKRKVMPSSGDSTDSEVEATTNERASLLPTENGETPPSQIGNSTFYAQYQSTESTPSTSAEPQVLSPPSSPETPTRPGPSGAGRRPKKGCKIVPGFLRSDSPGGSSTENLVVPVPADGEEVCLEERDEPIGIDNPGFEPIPTNSEKRRKRHPATSGGAGRQCRPPPPPLSDSEESEKEEAMEDAATSRSVFSERKMPKKKRKDWKRRRQVGDSGSRQATIPSSAPAALEEEGNTSPEEIRKPYVTREDSIQLDLGEKEEDKEQKDLA